MIARGLLRSLVAVLLVLTQHASAQQQPAAPAAQQPAPAGPAAADTVPLVFGEVLDVRVVNVEVVVTDKQGERVRGLGSKDFRLEVDGKEVPIDYFSEIVGGDVIT